jgi:hypothetical protein
MAVGNEGRKSCVMTWKISACSLALMVVLCGCKHEDDTEAAAGGGAPKLVIDKTSFNAGPLAANNTTIGHDFKVNNEGTETLVMHVQDTSGITFFPSERLGPGQSGTVHIDFDAYASGKDGDVSRDTKLYSNDPARRETVLKLTGHVDMQARIEPRTVTLGDLDPGATAVQQVQLVGPVADKLTLGELVADPKVQLSMKAGAVKPGSPPTVELTFAVPHDVKPSLARSNGTFWIKTTGGPADLRVRVDASWRVPPNLSATPMTVVIKSAAGQGSGAPIMPPVEIEARNHHAFKITSVTDSAHRVTAKITEESPGKVRLDGTVANPPDTIAYAAGTLTIATDDPTTPSLLVRYQLDRRPPQKPPVPVPAAFNAPKAPVPPPAAGSAAPASPPAGLAAPPSPPAGSAAPASPPTKSPSPPR